MAMVTAGEEVAIFLPAHFWVIRVLAMAQETVITKKRRGPAPTGKGTLVGVRLQPPDLEALDTWIAGQPEPRPSRPQAVRRLMERGLVAEENAPAISSKLADDLGSFA